MVAEQSVDLYTLPEDLQMLRMAVRQFVEDELVPLERDYPDQFALPPEVSAPLKKKAQEQGLWCLDAPEEYGGQGLGELAMCVVYEEVAKAAIGCEVFGPHVNKILIGAGTAEQKQKWLVPTVEGKLEPCWLLTEPGAGSDAANLATSARREGDNYILNGSKIFVGGAARSDYAVLVGRLQGTRRREGVTVFLVPTNAPGFKAVREIPTMGLPPGSWKPVAEVSLEDCVVPAENVLGEPGEGWRLMQDNMGTVRVRVGASAVGIAERCLQMAIAYAKQRTTFHAPLADRQAIQFMLVDSAMEIEAARHLVYAAATKIDRGEDARQEIFMAKVFGSEMVGRVVDRAIQVHGAVGYSKDMVLERYYRDVRSMRIVDGASEILRYVMARNLLRD